jgi:CheY-like chemotaxis protein
MAYRLLVVAGENETLRALPDQLDTIEVRQIESANDALWEVRTAPPEAIIADTDLPDMSGIDMAGILPSFDVQTRVILWSRTADAATRQKVEALGIYQFLQGDLSSEELQAVIHAAVDASVDATEQAELTAAAIVSDSDTDVPPPSPERENGSETADDGSLEDAIPPASVAEPDQREAAAEERASGPRRRLAGLAARTREAATQATQEHEHHGAAAAGGHAPRRSGNMVLTADNLAPIRSIMSDLSQELGPQCILLTDRAGMVLVEVGNTDTLPTMILLPLLSTSFSTAGEVARQLGEEDATTLYIHEGVNYDLYCFDIAQRFLLVLVFNKKVASSKIGAVWVNTKRAIRDLQEALLR